MAVIRFNPDHAPAQPKIGQGAAPAIKAPHQYAQVGGALGAHLGHFRLPHVLGAGHNTNGKMKIDRDYE